MTILISDRSRRAVPTCEMSDEQAASLNKACSDYRCSHSIAVSADQWADDLRLSDIEPRFVCQACGKRGADVRPDFNWNKTPGAVMGYR
jgi:hypothetical protein